MDHHSSHHDPTSTPRPTQTSFPDSGSYAEDQSELITPTRDTFQPPTNEYSPFNSSAGHNAHTFDPSSNPPKGRVARSGSTKSVPSEVGEGMEVEESDDDSTAGDANRPPKKKKGQRFFCTEYPPCNLSFTRSEHLARHIRKHTGERPFQCHCLRRFSRLDNLRQHAQTVHLNEDIPQGSLAATGTRFQRQIRTDRVRPSGSRVRASTISGQANFQRGHSRNVSGSSIGSTSDFGAPDDFRSRQQQHQQQHQHHHQHQQQQQQHHPIHMTQTTPGRMGLTVDTFGVGDAGPDHPYYPYYVQNTNGYSSPTPVFAADPHSPVAHAGLQSPIAMAPRGMTWAEPMHSRRMSVPSDSATFQSPSSYGSAMSYMSPLASSNASIYSNASSIITSPTSSTFSDPHQDHVTEAEMRRRTWHPGTYGTYGPRPATSGLSYHQTPDAPKPVATTQSAAAQNVRLPGIDSFDRGNHKPAARLLRPLSPMEMDASPRHTQADPHSFDEPSTPTHKPQRSLHVATQSAPQSLETAAREISAAALTNAALTPRRQKREAWYNGPLRKDGQQQQQQLRTSPGGSSSDGPRTPSTSSISEYHPAIVPSSDFVDSPSHTLGNESSKINDAMMSEHTLQASPTHLSPRRNGDMDRLDALVAVATSESQATGHY